MQIAKKTVDKFIALVLVVVLTMADFVVIGINFASFAIDAISTTNENVKVEAYFKDESGTKIFEQSENINAEQFNMYVDISILKEGYFNGKVCLENSNFSIIGNTQNDYISGIEENIVYLNQINSGKTITLELQVKPKVDSKISAESLDKETNVKLEGIYTYSKGQDGIASYSSVRVKFVSPEDIKSVVDTKILTNKIYEINGSNKRILQVLVTGNIENNMYPVKDSKLELSLPENIESVDVLARDTTATNPDIVFESSNYVLDKQKSKLNIKIENNKDKDGNIGFEKNAKDKFVVTCVYAEDSNLTNQASVSVAQEIVTYDNKVLKSNSQANIEKEEDGIVSYELIQQEDEIYKGKIYSGEERNYKINVKSYVNTTKINKNIKFTLNETLYIANSTKKESKITYKEVLVKREEFIKVLGEQGNLTLKDLEQNVIANITKETQSDENGNIVIKIPENIYKINVETSTPICAGMINFQVEKSIIESQYDRSTINELTNIENSITYGEENQVKQMTLKETQTSAKLSINKTTFVAGETNNVELRVTLMADNESRDLYKNPCIKIALPKQTTQLNAKYKALYLNGLEKGISGIKEENGTKYIEINLLGEQKNYPGEAVNGTEILINADITLNEQIEYEKENMEISYSNENAVNIENNGVITQEISVVKDNSINRQMLMGASSESSSSEKIVATLEKTGDEVETFTAKSIYAYKLSVKNNSEETLENVGIKINTNELLTISQAYSNEISEDGVANIDKINAGEEKTINVYVKCLNKTKKEDKAEFSAEISVNQEKYYSNIISKEIEDISGKVTVTSKSSRDNEERTVITGDYIDYEIDVENTCVDDLNNVEIVCSMLNCVEIIEVTVDDNEVEYTKNVTGELQDEMELNIKTDLPAKQSKKIKITTQIGEDVIVSSERGISNVVYLMYNSYIIADGVDLGYKIAEGDWSDMQGQNPENEEISQEIIGEPEKPEDIDFTVEDSQEDNEDEDENKVDEEGSENTNGENNNSDTESDSTKEGFVISGRVWLDEDKTGKRTSSSKTLGGIRVKLIDELGNNVKDKDGIEISAETNNEGKYKLEGIAEGRYIVVFEYDTNKYKPTEYQKEGVSEEYNSDAIISNTDKNGMGATTDIIDVNKNITNIDLGLVKAEIFDLELTKVINKITVANDEGTKEYSFKDSTLAKIEINSKHLNNSKVTIEYAIKVKNTGDVPGFVKSIVDYIPADTQYDSSTNNQWSKNGEYLYNSSLASEEIKPGETKEVSLTLTKVMTEANTGLLSNVAEIAKAENSLGILDVDSTPNNRKEGEDDIAHADVIISVGTGALITYFILTVAVLAIVGIGVYLINKKVLKVEN